jgi:hypothetical protein
VLRRSWTHICRRSGHFGVRALRSSLFRPSTAWLTARMAFWVVSLSLLVRLLPLPRVMRLLTPSRKVRPAGEDSGELPVCLAQTLDILLMTNLWVFTPTCWKRASILYRYLALKGIETRIVFGMRKEDEGALTGHAWLEAGGRPLFEMSTPSYAVTYIFPPAHENTGSSA